MAKQRYSFIDAAKRCVESKRPSPGGLEGEVSSKLARSFDISPRGFLMPLPALLGGPEARALDTTAGAGSIFSALTGTADILRPKLVTGLLGATIGDFRPDTPNYGRVTIPRKTGAAAVSWVGDGAAPGSQTNPTTTAATLNMRTVSAYTEVTTRMLSSAGPDLEKMIIDDLVTGAAVELDRVALAGSGSGGQPLGILGTSGIGSVAIGTNGGAPTRAMLLSLEKTVAAANGDSSASAALGWAASVNVRTKMRSIDGSTGNSGAWLWPDSDKVLGRPAYATANMPDNGAKGTGTNLGSLVYGDWSNLVIQIFGAVDILIGSERVKGTHPDRLIGTHLGLQNSRSGQGRQPGVHSALLRPFRAFIDSRKR